MEVKSKLAQEVKKVVPEAVFNTSSGLYGFNDRPIVALLTKSVQEHQEEIKNLKKRIEILEELIKNK